jgi:DsbC/DsbD-like thiol-disulfide interchange protein
MRTALIWMGLLAFMLCGTPQAQQGTASQGRSFVSFMPVDTVTVSAGHKTPVAFTFRVEKGYHINSNKPLAEELIPTQLHFTLPGEIVIGKVEYPAGVLMSFPFDPTQKLSVYSGDVVIHAVVLAPQGAQPGPLTVHGELKYQACDNNACYPPKKLPITFNVKIGAGGSGRSKAHGNKQSPHIH